MVNDEARKRVTNSFIRNLKQSGRVLDVEEVGYTDNELEIKLRELVQSDRQEVAEELIYQHNPYLYNQSEYCVSILDVSPSTSGVGLRVRFGITPYKADAYLR